MAFATFKRPRFSRPDLVLAIVPAIMVVLALAWIQVRGEFQQDPDYVYLLNGLTIFQLHAPAYSDHPGTPLQLLIAGTIPAIWLPALPAIGLLGPVDAVLSHPEIFLHGLNLLLVFANAAAAFYFAWSLRTATESLWVALVAQASILFSLTAAEALSRVSPEPLLSALILTLMGTLAPMMFRGGPVDETPHRAAAIGALLGIIFATKVTAGPLIFTVLLFERPDCRRRLLAFAVAFSVITTLPVVGHYPAMLRWFYDVVFHTGSYGNGGFGLFSIASFFDHARRFFSQEPQMLVEFGLYLVAIGWAASTARKLPPGPVRLLRVTVLVLAVEALLLLKQPAPRYALPTIIFCGLGNGAIAYLLLRARSAWRYFGAGILVIGVAVGLWHQQQQVSDQFAQMGETRRAVDALLARASADGCRIVPYYSLKTPLFSLAFGDNFTGGRYGQRLARLHPNFVYYPVSRPEFHTFSKVIQFSDAASLFGNDKCVYLIGSPAERFDNFWIPPSALTTVDKTSGTLGTAIAAYMLDWHKLLSPGSESEIEPPMVAH